MMKIFLAVVLLSVYVSRLNASVPEDDSIAKSKDVKLSDDDSSLFVKGKNNLGLTTYSTSYNTLLAG
jgi:hypothetical protein